MERGINTMMRQKGFWLVAPLLLAIAVIQGCGNANIFKQFGLVSGTGASTVSNLESILQEAGPENPDKYNDVIAAANALINSSETSTADRQKALSYKGEALLGKNGITVSEIISNLNNGGDTSLDAFDLASVSANEISQAAQALNAASSAGNLSSDQQMTRAIANAVAISSLVNNSFSVTNNSVAVKGDGSAETALSQLVAGSGDADDGLGDFASALADSVADIAGLDDEQKSTVTDVSEKADDATELNGAVASRNATYQIGDQTFDFSNSNTRDSNITSALSTIFFGSN